MQITLDKAATRVVVVVVAVGVLEVIERFRHRAQESLIQLVTYSCGIALDISGFNFLIYRILCILMSLKFVDHCSFHLMNIQRSKPYIR